MTDFFGIGPKGGTGGGITAGGATAASGKMIYKGTGKVIPGSAFKNNSQACWALSSGGCRSSSRFQCEKGCCVPYHDLEATVYLHVGPHSSHSKGSARLILSAGGPGQSGNNCCVYSLGFTEAGQAYAEEEGPHSPHPHIYPMPVTGGVVRNIGPIANRTIGLKNIIWHTSGNTFVEGWVDQKADGNWQLFYRAVNPHGGNLPVITHSPMSGSTCQEVRCRVDNYWPINFDASRTFIAELAMPISPLTVSADSKQQMAGMTPAQIELTTGKKPQQMTTTAVKKTSSKKKKSNFAFEYDGNMHYLEQPMVSTLWSEY